VWQTTQVLATVVYGETCSSTCRNIQRKTKQPLNHRAGKEESCTGLVRRQTHLQHKTKPPRSVPINLEAHTTKGKTSTAGTDQYRGTHNHGYLKLSWVDGTTLESKSPTAKAEPINLKAHSPRVPQAGLGWRRNTEQTLACKCLADNINTRRAGKTISVYTGRKCFHLVTIHAPCGKERLVHGA
jgi:hypothetical protein